MLDAAAAAIEQRVRRGEDSKVEGKGRGKRRVQGEKGKEEKRLEGKKGRKRKRKTIKKNEMKIENASKFPLRNHSLINRVKTLNNEFFCQKPLRKRLTITLLGDEGRFLLSIVDAF